MGQVKLLRKIARFFKRDRDLNKVEIDVADYRILFVCMGNICRSPTAEGVFRTHVETHAPQLKLYIDSAGTHAYHVGEPPDRRARRAAERRGIDLEAIRSRRVDDADFERFDLILVMDSLNLETLRDRCPAELHDRIRLFLEFADEVDYVDVPDPYYGGVTGFERVLDLVEIASNGLLAHVIANQRK